MIPDGSKELILLIFVLLPSGHQDFYGPDLVMLGCNVSLGNPEHRICMISKAISCTFELCLEMFGKPMQIVDRTINTRSNKPRARAGFDALEVLGVVIMLREGLLKYYQKQKKPQLWWGYVVLFPFSAIYLRKCLVSCSRYEARPHLNSSFIVLNPFYGFNFSRKTSNTSFFFIYQHKIM